MSIALAPAPWALPEHSQRTVQEAVERVGASAARFGVRRDVTAAPRPAAPVRRAAEPPAAVAAVVSGAALQLAAPQRGRHAGAAYGRRPLEAHVHLECSAEFSRNFTVLIRQELLRRRAGELHKRILEGIADPSTLGARETLGELRRAKKRVYARAMALLYATSRAQQREWRTLPAATRDAIVSASEPEFRREVARVERGLPAGCPESTAVGCGPGTRDAERFRPLVLATMLVERIGELRARAETGIDRRVPGREDLRRATEIRLLAALREITVPRSLWAAWTTLRPEQLGVVMAEGRTRFRSEFERLLAGERVVAVLTDLRCTLAEALREAHKRGVCALVTPHGPGRSPRTFDSPMELLRLFEQQVREDRFDRIYTVLVDGTIHNTLTQHDVFVPLAPAFMEAWTCGADRRSPAYARRADLVERAA